MSEPFKVTLLAECAVCAEHAAEDSQAYPLRDLRMSPSGEPYCLNCWEELAREDVGPWAEAETLEHRLSTTPPPAPAGEREAFTQEDFNKFTEWYERQKDMPLEGMGRGWRIWKQARASSPAPALERRVPGGPACPTCGFKITVGKKPPFMSDDDPAPALELTSEAMRGIAAEVISIMQTYDEQKAEGCVDTPGGLEHMGDVWRLLDEWRKRLTTPADGEGGR